MSEHMTLSIDRVRQVAGLARLTLTDDEVGDLTKDLGQILNYVKKLEELDVSSVPPTAHAVSLPTALRPDEPRKGLSLEKGMAGAPERLGDGFGVPKIIE